MSPNTWSRIRTITICVVIFCGSFAWWAYTARQDEAKKAAVAEAKAQEEADKRYAVKGRYVDMGDGPHEPFKSPVQSPDSKELPGTQKPGVERERPRMRIGKAEE
ncbi:hypothetical protein [Haloferula sp. BvORR071]|uniref:hypothetical protein n=1 Tax=Haloferula sp. BvORR071 TaxID=1396141 RepID=UPI00054E8D1F|nr:hypothetical protein [Haloferula sp. BvORR071]